MLMAIVEAEQLHDEVGGTACPSVAASAAAPMSFSAHSGDQLTMCTTGFDPSCPIVVLGGAQITVPKQVAGNADLIGRENSPGCCRRISYVVTR